MDTVQAQICKTLGTQGHYQRVLNCQKRVKPQKAVTQEHVHLLQDDISHWFLSFLKRSCINMRESQLNLDSNIEKNPSKSCIEIFPMIMRMRWLFSCLCKTDQQDGLVAEIINGKSPIDAVFHVPQLCNNRKFFLEIGTLTPFPKV